MPINYSYDYVNVSSQSKILPLIYLMVIINMLFICFIFHKHYKLKWYKALIPFYNIYLMTKKVFGNGWLVLLMLIPVVNIIFGIFYSWRFVKTLNHGLPVFILNIFLSPIAVAYIAFSSKTVYTGRDTTNDFIGYRNMNMQIGYPNMNMGNYNNQQINNGLGQDIYGQQINGQQNNGFNNQYMNNQNQLNNQNQYMNNQNQFNNQYMNNQNQFNNQYMNNQNQYNNNNNMYN